MSSSSDDQSMSSDDDHPVAIKEVILKGKPTVVERGAITKALGSVLQYRHCTRMMGCAGSPYTSTYGKMTTKTSSEA